MRDSGVEFITSLNQSSAKVAFSDAFVNLFEGCVASLDLVLCELACNGRQSLVTMDCTYIEGLFSHYDLYCT